LRLCLLEVRWSAADRLKVFLALGALECLSSEDLGLLGGGQRGALHGSKAYLPD
jgi:hypothetical protein